MRGSCRGLFGLGGAAFGSIILLAAVVLPLLGCDDSSRPASHSPQQVSSQPAYLQVGKHHIDIEQVELREQLLLWKHGQQGDSRIGAVAQLVQGYLLAEVLESIGHPITEEQLSAEVERIDQETLRPARLEELKRMCGGEDSRAYREIAILPDFANR